MLGVSEVPDAPEGLVLLLVLDELEVFVAFVLLEVLAVAFEPFDAFVEPFEVPFGRTGQPELTLQLVFEM